MYLLLSYLIYRLSKTSILLLIPWTNILGPVIQVEFVKNFRKMCRELNFNIFSKDMLYYDSLYPYNNTLDVKDVILRTKYKNSIFITMI